MQTKQVTQFHKGNERNLRRKEGDLSTLFFSNSHFHDNVSRFLQGDKGLLSIRGVLKIFAIRYWMGAIVCGKISISANRRRYLQMIKQFSDIFGRVKSRKTKLQLRRNRSIEILEIHTLNNFSESFQNTFRPFYLCKLKIRTRN